MSQSWNLTGGPCATSIRDGARDPKTPVPAKLAARTWLHTTRQSGVKDSTNNTLLSSKSNANDIPQAYIEAVLQAAATAESSFPSSP
jgi:hypothetical protein